MGEIPNLRERATSAWRRDYDESHDGAEAEGVADRQSGNLGRVSRRVALSSRRGIPRACFRGHPHGRKPKGQEAAEMVTQRRVATNIKVLPPEVVPISPEDYQQAVTALAQIIEQWWRNHHDDEPSMPQGDNAPATS